MPTRTLALLLTALAASAQPPDPLLAWMDRQAQQHLDRRDQALAQLRTAADFDQRRALVRRQLLDLIGGLPSYRGPLNVKKTGQIAAAGYVIEKLYYQSLPGIYVTANLYRPSQSGRYPGVLIPSGHTQEGKPEPQLLAANLARKGFVALTYDPIGQGEREQTYLPILGRPLAGGGGNEHLELGARSLMIGQSVARYFIHDGQRGLDLLAARPDVDATRLGVTGCSGGGAITAYIAALDPRIQAAAAGCFISTFRNLFTGATPDSEMSLPRFLAAGLDWADLFTLRAPLPWLMMATTEDYFPPAAARPVYEEAQRIYRLYGAEDRLRYHVGPGPHGTPRESREEIYRWLIRWLRNGDGDPTEQPAKLYTNLELRVTPSGNVDGEPASRKLHQAIHDEFRARRQPRGVADLRQHIQRLGIAPAVAPQATIVETTSANGLRIERLRWESEPGVPIAANLYLPRAEGPRPAVLIVEEKRLPVPLYVQRSAATTSLAEAFAAQGTIVLELDPRDSPAALDGRPFLGNWLTNERADLIGRNLAALRAQDILTGVALLAARPGVDARSLGAYAKGVKGVWLLLAAAADPRLKKLWLDRTPTRLATAFESPYTNLLFEAMIPGFALHWDFDTLVAALDGRRVLWSDPTNWMNQIIAAGSTYRYRHVGEGDAPLVREFLR